MKRHALAQVKLPHRGRFQAPCASQRRRELQIFAARDQCFKHIVEKGQLHRFIQRMWIKREHIALVAHAKAGGLTGAPRCACECADQEYAQTL